MLFDDRQKETADLCKQFLDIDPKLSKVPQEFLDASEAWLISNIQSMTEAGILSPVDAGGVQKAVFLFLNMMICQRELMLVGYFYETETGKKAHPAGGEFRAYYKMLTEWEGQHALYPMARHNKGLNLEQQGGKVSHGNKNVLDLIMGKK